MGFRAEYEPLEGAGRVALLPWDEPIFGFPVGDLAVDDGASPARIAGAVGAWARARGAELISAALPAERRDAIAALQRAGFRVVDGALQVRLPRLDAATLPRDRRSVRAASPAEHDLICEIAARSFGFGRYHADPRFPRALADKRYGVWAHNALSSGDPRDRLFVMGSPVSGFFHAVVDGDGADLRLAAVDERAAPGAGAFLYGDVLHALAAAGVKRATGKVSYANVAVVQLFAALGFRFQAPEVVLHWHAPWATHLVAVAE